MQLMFQKCAYLDPRFKDLDPFISEDERCDVIEAVKLDMLEYVNQEEDEPNEEVTEETDLSISAVSNPPKKRKVQLPLYFLISLQPRIAEEHLYMTLYSPKLGDMLKRICWITILIHKNGGALTKMHI